MKTIKEQIVDIECELELMGKRIECTEEEVKQYKQLEKDGGKLPNGIVRGDLENIYYKYQNFSENQSENKNDIKYLLTLQRTKYLRTIKNCVMFFTIASIIGIVIYIFSLLSHM